MTRREQRGEETEKDSKERFEQGRVLNSHKIRKEFISKYKETNINIFSSTYKDKKRNFFLCTLIHCTINGYILCQV